MFLSKLATRATSSLWDKFKRNIRGQGAVGAGKGLTIFISNETMDYINKIVQSLKKSGSLSDGATETVKHEIKKQEREFFGAMVIVTAASLIALMASSLIQHVTSSLINAISGKGVIRVGKRQENAFLPRLALPLMMEVLGKGVRRTGRKYNNMNHMDKNAYIRSIL